MPNTKKPIRILYNESFLAISSVKKPVQLGVARFAESLRNHFVPNKNYAMTGLIFIHEEGLKTPYLRSTRRRGQVFAEVVYDAATVRSIYKEEWTRAVLIGHLAPIISIVKQYLDQERPDTVFLNGFSLMNWVLLFSAHSSGIPTVIQHAGVWKKEILQAKSSFSASLRRIFYQMERDTVSWCSRHIFLNEHSKRVFERFYGPFVSPVSIIPLPIVGPKTGIKKDFRRRDGASVRIGTVARWDSIKNHAAILRLALALVGKNNWSISAVLTLPKKLSDFAKRYSKNITIVPPMQPAALNAFYASIDALLLLSHFETVGGVVAEALLVGTPVLISDQVGWVDEFKRFGLGDSVLPTNSSGPAIMRAVQRSLDSGEENAKKYRALVRHILSEHNPEKVFKQYEAVFTSIK